MCRVALSEEIPGRCFTSYDHLSMQNFYIVWARRFGYSFTVFSTRISLVKDTHLCMTCVYSSLSCITG
jgi:hypothetical protein